MNSIEYLDNGMSDMASPTNHHDYDRQQPSDKSDILSEIAALLNADLPEGRISLVDNHTNLERVAEYCEANYFQADNKRAALEETKNYTTQSLASVAYQINTLAFNFSQLLDLETTQLQNMERDLDYISQIIDIHKEKVARREIGVLAANKIVGRQHKIIALPNQEKPVKYVRKPIDFTILDKIGHGCKSDKMDSSITPAMGTIKVHHKQRANSQSSIQSGLSLPAPTTKPPTPPQISRAANKIVGTGTLSKGSREYRTPPAVAPPQVPSHYAPNYPKKPGYSTLPFATPQVNPVQYGQPNVQNNNEIYKSSNVNRTALLSNNSNMVVNMSNESRNSSPPLPSPPPPPPPPVPDSDSSQNSNFINRTSTSHLAPIVPQDADLPGWVPKNYIEKVVAIYDYYADKDDELSFQDSAVIYVLKKNDDGWWEGVMDGITGLFPGNYVEPCI